MSCAFPCLLDTDQRLALADRVSVFHQPLDDLRRSKGPRCGDRVLRAARYHRAEMLLIRPRPEGPRGRRPDQLPLRQVAVPVGIGFGEVPGDQLDAARELIASWATPG